MKKLITFFVHNKLIVKVLIIVVFAFGLLSTTRLQRSAMPEVDLDQLVITTIHRGASALDIELNISKKIEDELSGVDGIDKYISISSENNSVITVWLDIDHKNKEKVKDDIKKAVDRAATFFPKQAEKPYVVEVTTKIFPVLRYLISSKTLSEKEIRQVAKNIETELKDINEVSGIRKIGYRDLQYRVLADIRQMKRKNISLQDIATAIRNHNIRASGGTLQSTTAEKSIVTMSQFRNLKELKNVIIRTNFEGYQVRIKDVAQVKEGFETRELYARSEGKNGIILEVLKKENADIIRTVEKVKAKLKKCMVRIDAKIKSRPFGNGKTKHKFKKSLLKNQKNYCADVSVQNVFDMTTNTRSLLRITVNNALIGFIFVVLVLLIFLDLKSAFWTAFGIPFTLMLVFICMKWFGFSINNISLFGLVTVLGILVDDGIITAENIYRKKELGLKGYQAAIEGSYEVFYPILGTVLTTIFAFLPLAFMSGIMGDFLFQLPVVVIIALTGSLIEVFIGLPSHMVDDEKKKKKKIEPKKWFLIFQKGYKWILKKALKLRYLVVILFIFLLLLAFKIQKSMPFILFSNKETNHITILLETPEGTNLEENLRRVKKVEKILLKEVPKQKELESLTSQVGRYEPGRRAAEKAAHKTTIQLYLVPFSRRLRTAEDIVKELKGKKLKEKKEIKKLFKKIIIKEMRPGPPVGEPVELKVVSNNDKLRTFFANKIKNFLKKQTGIFSIEDDSENTKQEILLLFRYNYMYRLGVNPMVVANTVRTAFNGDIVTSIVRSDEDIDISVQLKKKYRRRLSYLKELLIPTTYRRQIRLGQIARFKYRKTQVSFSRYNGMRATTITGQVNFIKNTPVKIMRAINKKFRKEIRNYPEVKLIIGGEGEHTKKSLKDTGIAFIFAIFGIFIILLLIFRSLTQPLLVLGVIPFGLIGIIFAFKIHGEPFGFFALVGVIGLAGVVVNDSIVMVDLMNRLVKQGEGKLNKMEFLKTIITGASERLRPIILTTITTVAGLIPTVYGLGGSNAMLRPLTMALAYGLVFGTTITLFLIPSFYMIDQDFRNLGRKIKRMFKRKLES